jgi:oligopeptide transport system ATP-binding protein
MSNNPVPDNSGTEPFLRAERLCKSYSRGGAWEGNFPKVEALRGVDLQLQRGSAMALIGASGCGKSTLARCIAGLEELDSGEIWIAGKQVKFGASRHPVADVQLIFQDAALSFNPRFSSWDVVSEPLLIANWGNETRRRDRALELMRMVGLSADADNRRPEEFSGGQRGRLAIARALAIRPKLLILDEALAGLDLSTQSQIANLLLDLQADHGLTYLWISHDLAFVANLADEVVVMDAGRIVEARPTRELLAHPQCPQARVLVEAASTGRKRPA